jgi:Fibronectin type III domain
MPTISQLPIAVEVTAADEIPVSQAGVTHSVSIGTLLASTQPAIISDPSTLLGRISLGAGGPETVTVGTGLLLNGGTLAASAFNPSGLPQRTTLSLSDNAMLNSNGTLAQLPLSSLRGLFSAGANINIDATGKISSTVTTGGTSNTYSITSLVPVTSIASGDLVGISQGGADHTITYTNLLDGLTIDLAQPAVPASDTDTLWVAQGSSTMLRQTFAAIWSWLTSRQPTYRLPVVEIIANTNLDGTIHNGRILICSQPVTLTPVPLNMGSGFYCDIINLSSGNVTLGSGVITSSGSASLQSGQAAIMRVAAYSGGTVVFASLAASSAGGSSAPAIPGQVTGLSASNPTSSGVTLNWSAPSSGDAVSSYTVQYRVTGTTTWSTFATGVTATNASATGLTASTAYDFQVYALNGGGAGPLSATASASTTVPPGSVISVTWNLAPTGPYAHGVGSIGVNAHINPSTAAVQFGFSPSATARPSTWVVANYVNTDLWGAYVSTPASAGTWYAWVEGTDGSTPTVYPTPFTVT